MLSTGHVVRKMTRTKGTSTREGKDVYEIVYDQDYVKEKIARTLLNPLGIKSKAELLNLVDRLFPEDVA